ncbi:pyridoxal phosphate-dependent aminotransferase [Candidatus Thorarchaeota archaeon]|nr:MAG: pyridoxal phosphate-dependent aminotransferase [Candidatus Thorarchaeota archaeon]
MRPMASRDTSETSSRGGISLLLHIGESPGLLSLGIGEPSFDTPEHIVETAVKSLRDGHTHYSPDSGLLSLRQAIAEKTERENGFSPSPESEIVVTAGTSPALYGSILATIDAGDEVVVPTPAYLAYEPIIRIADGSPVVVPMNEENRFNPTPDDLAQAISPRTKMIVVSSPSNPTGSVWTKESIRAVADLAIDHNLLVVSDELYERIVFDGEVNHSPGSLDGMQEHTITINGLSKSHAMAGFRLGWVIAPKQIIGDFLDIHKYSSICAPVASQHAAEAALTGPQDAVAEMVAEYDRRRRLLVERLNREVPFVSTLAPKGSFFLFANVKTLTEQRGQEMRAYLRKDAKHLLDTLPPHLFAVEDLEESGSLTAMLYLVASAKVLTVSGAFFGSGGEGFLRMSFAQSYDVIDDAVTKMAESLSGFE